MASHRAILLLDMLEITKKIVFIMPSLVWCC